MSRKHRVPKKKVRCYNHFLEQLFIGYPKICRLEIFQPILEKHVVLILTPIFGYI